MLIPVIGTEALEQQSDAEALEQQSDAEALEQQGDGEAVERTPRQTGEAGHLQDCGEREVWSTEQSAAYTL